MAALQRVDLLRRGGVRDLDHHFIGHQTAFVGCRRATRAPPGRSPRTLRRVDVIVDISPARRPHLRDCHEYTGHNTPAAPVATAAIITAAAAHRPAGADILAAAENSLRKNGIGCRQRQSGKGYDEQDATMCAHGETSGAKRSSHSVVAMKPTTLSSCSFLTMRARSVFGNPVIDTRTL